MSARLVLTLGVLLVAPACFSPQISPTGVSALQQRLVAESLERALAGLPLPLHPRAHYQIEVTIQDQEQEAFVRRMAERELQRQGLLVVRGAESADVVISLQVSALSTDRDRTTIGIPFLTAILSALAAPVPGTDTTPLAIYDDDVQRGLARMRVECRTPDRTRLLTAGEVVGTSYFSKTTFLTFIGPFTGTDLPAEPRASNR